ncbi:MAG: hypothetical protein ACOX6Y_02375 [Christensenellales bacterium]
MPRPILVEALCALRKSPSDILEELYQKLGATPYGRGQPYPKPPGQRYPSAALLIDACAVPAFTQPIQRGV